MASGFQPPMLIWSSDNLSDAFRTFEQYCSLIFEGPFSAKTEKEKVTYLLLWIGHHGLDVYDSAETETQLVEQLIVGTKHTEVQEKLLEKGDSLSSFDMALETARTFEATKDQLAKLQTKIDVHAIHTAESE